MNNFKILPTILFILFFCNNIGFAAEFASIGDIFPKSGELRGGTSAWIASGVTKQKRGRCEMYENTYTYYSKTGEKIMDIVRSNTYMVSVRIYACENFLTAMNEFEKLSAVSKEFKDKKMTATVPFGERGILLAMPPKDKNSQMTDFYLTFLLRSFVVQVYSDDGFAQMDMSGEIEKRLAQYMVSLGASYFINKLNLEAEYGGKKYPSALSFTGDNITTVALSGTVFDADNKPLPNVTVTARETGQKTVTDKHGRYTLEVTAGKGKSVALTKMLFVPVKGEGGGSIISTGVYKINAKKGALKADILNILVTGGAIMGTLSTVDEKISLPVKGSVSSDGVRFSADCAQSSASLKCNILFKGADSGGKLTGSFAGGGSKGEWVIDRTALVPVTESIYPIDLGLKLSQIKGSAAVKSGVLKADNAKERSFVKLDVTGVLADKLFFKGARLEMQITAIDIEGKTDIILYEIKDDKPKQLLTVASFNRDNVPDTISVDIGLVLRSRSAKGYMIGVESAKKASISFAPVGKNVDTTYYRNVSGYVQKQIAEGRLKTFDGADIVSNSNTLKGDMDGDIELELTINAKGRTLESIEITAEGESTRKWNTNTFDIYPLAALSLGGETLNAADGSVNHTLTKDSETFTVNLYRGTLLKENVKRIKVSVVLDGKVYDNEISLK